MGRPRHCGASGIGDDDDARAPAALGVAGGGGGADALPLPRLLVDAALATGPPGCGNALAEAGGRAGPSSSLLLLCLFM